MDLFELLKTDHRKVKSLFEKLEKTTVRSSKNRQTLIQQLKQSLLPHMQAEEELFYPLLVREDDTRELGLMAMEEHRVARNVLSDLDELSFDDELWLARCTLAGELVRHHIQEEEQKIFKEARKFLDTKRRSDLARQFQQAKKQVQKQAA